MTAEPRPKRPCVKSLYALVEALTNSYTESLGVLRSGACARIDNALQKCETKQTSRL